MSDPFQERRQPNPSPEFTFPTTYPKYSGSGSSSNTVSMPFVRRHVTRRVKAAKAECDKELQRVTNSITSWFEERLRDGDHERESERELREIRDMEENLRDHDSPQHGEVEGLREPFTFMPAELRSALPTDESSSDGGCEPEMERGRHSPQHADTDDNLSKAPALTHWSSSPGLYAASSTPLSPSLRRQSTLPWEKSLSASLSSSSPTTSALPSSEGSSSRKLSNAPVPPWGTQGISRRLSRTIHIPVRPTCSGQSSRSTSRSRSPLPPNPGPNFSDSWSSISSNSSANRCSSRILVDDPVDPIMTALYELISVATDVTEMSLAQLTSQPKSCETLVQRLQNIGKVWDEHPDWHGRNWYVQVLLAVASLSRVVEWWEAEKQFWNFDDNDDEEDEPLTFVTKQAEEQPIPTPTSTPLDAAFPLTPEGPGLTGQAKKTRDEPTRNLASSGTPSQDLSHGDASKAAQQSESARVLATERLRLQAEMAQNQNIVVELSLDGDHLIWVNYAWKVVVGTDPDDLAGTLISHLLPPEDKGVFFDATEQLQQDDSHTVEARFRLRVQAEDDWEPACGVLYRRMEGKGMLMIDREDGHPTHTMWVMKPISLPSYDAEGPSTSIEGDIGEDYVDASRMSNSDELEPLTPFPFDQPISTEPILCRICDCEIPQWYFEKHSETCVETHRLEAEISDCNESISELRNTIRELSVTLERSSPVTVPEYRGMQIFSPGSSPTLSSPLQIFRIHKLQRQGVKKMQRRLLEQLDEVLRVTLEVSIPTVKEDSSKEPIERQRLLSPSSERKISRIRKWSKPNIEDAALGQLVEDAERVMRQKIDNVVRMQNTIMYSEKIRQEWEEKIAETLATTGQVGDETETEGDVDTVETAETVEAESDHSDSTTSEYAFINDTSESTPMASSSAVPIQAGNRANPLASIVSSIPGPAQVLFPHPRSLHTRSSTPSSVSSPLALAVPIVAPSSPEAPPSMSLDEPRISEASYLTHRNSVQILSDLQPLLTPPLSPIVSPRDGRLRSRRHSSAPRPPALSPSRMSSSGPVSPRLPSAAPLSKSAPTSIKDFDIIKPISKGAFGSVFLAKKRLTGDYYAIKVLKKADMISKNQVTNVKAERMILIQQAESPFVAKLYFTFQSKENLYLVMEYLNGGDCAALVKSIGALPEEWTKNYIAEVVLGLEYLHQRGVVHRDLKPDNLLIDQHGHLKLTDFGLSRIGLLGRQNRQSHLALQAHHARYNSRSRPPSMDSSYLSSPLFSTEPPPYFTHRTHQSSLSSSMPIDDVSESESISGISRRKSMKAGESPLQSFATELTTDLRSHSNLGDVPFTTSEQRFVGTPDYLAPETILGLHGDDATVDWWALGVITYEFLYGIPPFHADTPEKVFENILSGHIEWDWVDHSPEAKDFMQRLLTVDPSQRLGANGADEVKAHPFFKGIEWDKVTTKKAAFIPQIDDPESTDYFDPRGAVPQLFRDDEQVALCNHPISDSPQALNSPTIPSISSVSVGSSREIPTPPSGDDFGSFSFKNLPVLKQANDDVIRKLKTDQMAPMAQNLSEPHNPNARRKSVSLRIKKPPNVTTSMESKPPSTNPPSPATSTSSIASSPSRVSQQPSTPGSGGHVRKPSEYGAIERFKLNHLDNSDRKNSMPSRLRTSSISSMGESSGSENWPPSLGYSSGNFEANTPPSSIHSIDLKKAPDPSDRAVTCLLAEDNPITAKIIETLLTRLGCRCVVVSDGSEAISVALGDIKFDCILMDLQMPVLDGEVAARYIKSTNNKNTETPIIAISAYGSVGATNLFAASLAKPLQKADLLTVMRQLGFKTSSVHGPAEPMKFLRRIPA